MASIRRFPTIPAIDGDGIGGMDEEEFLDGRYGGVLVTPKKYGALGGGADDTVAMQAFFNAGGGWVDQDYTFGNIIVDGIAHLVLDGPGEFQRKNATAGGWIEIDDVDVVDIKSWRSNGRKANQTYTSTVGTADLWLHDCGEVSWGQMRFRDSVGVPALITDISDPTGGLLVAKRHQREIFFEDLDGGDLGRILSQDASNGTAAVNAHAVDFWLCRDVQAFIEVRRQSCTAFNLSTWFSGITMNDVLGGNFRCRSLDPDENVPVRNLATSFVGCNDTVLDAPYVRGSSTCIELAGCRGMEIRGGVLDCDFYRPTADPVDSSSIIYHSGGFYPNISGHRARMTTSSQNNLVIGTVLKRGYQGIRVRHGYLQCTGIKCLANRKNGALIEADTVTPTGSFPGANAAIIDQVTFDGCEMRGNGYAGLLAEVGNNIRVLGGTYINNGQTDAVLDDKYKAGMCFHGTVTGIVIDRPDCGDYQDWTSTAGGTFEPGATTANVRKLFTLIGPRRVGLGERLNVVNGAGGSTDISGIVEHDYMDEVELWHGLSATPTYSETGNLTALAGTVSSSGITLTGTGTAWHTAVKGRFWVKAASQYRQFQKVTSATVGYVTVAPSPAWSGASAEAILVDLAGVPSQQYGIYFHDNCTGIELSGAKTTGVLKTAQPIRLPAILTNCKIGAIYEGSVDLDDDEAIEFAPPCSSGIWEVTDGLNTFGRALFRTSPFGIGPIIDGISRTKIGDTQNVEFVTTGLTTGTGDGTDAYLAMGVELDAMQLKNRRGDARTFTYTIQPLSG